MLDKERLKKIQLVILDLDGTLLNDSGEIGKESISLIHRLEKKGVQFSFASGRLHSALTEYARQLQITTPLISLDGALIKSYPEGSVIHQIVIPEHQVKKAIGLADRFLVKIALCHADAIYFTEHNATIPNIIDKFGAKFEEVESYNGLMDNTLELVFISDYRDNIRSIGKLLTFPKTWGLSISYTKSHMDDGMYFMEVRKKGSNKATGLKRLMRHLNIGIRETSVVGDWYNDKELFETKALKIALANAVAEIKYLSDYTTERTNNEDGVAEYLQKMLDAKS